MTILRVEKSNPAYGRANTTILTIHSSHLNSRHDISVYQQPSPNNDIPIVVLLHGVYGSHWVWMESGGVHLVYEQLRLQGLSEFILVMPSDGGLWDGSAYLPLIDASSNRLENFEQWIVDDVIQATRDNIEGATGKSNLYISGLSMGGFGALRLGAKFPEKFNGISAHSAVTSLDDLQQFIKNPISDYICADVDEANLTYWLEKNRMLLPPLRFDCGCDDTLFKRNVALAKVMTDLVINHQFEALPGAHEWSYWHQNIAKTLNFFHRIEHHKDKYTL